MTSWISFLCEKIRKWRLQGDLQRTYERRSCKLVNRLISWNMLPSERWAVPPGESSVTETLGPGVFLCPARRLAKSTLLLIPLFGIHYVVFLSESIAEVYKIFFDLALGSFQVLLKLLVLLFILLEIIVNDWISMYFDVILDVCGRVWWWPSSTAFSTLRWVLALPSTTCYVLTSSPCKQVNHDAPPPFYFVQAFMNWFMWHWPGKEDIFSPVNLNKNVSRKPKLLRVCWCSAGRAYWI